MPSTKHALHSMCSYLGCFPPTVPRKLLDEHVAYGERVLDPFCGAGTTLLESLLERCPVVGVDLNPLAIAISRAKIQHVGYEDVLSRVLELARNYDGRVDLAEVPEDVKIIFHPRTLSQLVFLREHLSDKRPEDVFLRGAILGIMHGKFRKGGGTAYLSIDMPNTFSMSPEYVKKFVRMHGLRRHPLDAFRRLREKVDRLFRDGGIPRFRGVEGTVYEGDATQLHEVLANEQPFDAVITSPPYLGILRYGAFNWIRLWFLGHEPSPVDSLLDSTDSLDRYLSFIASFLISLAEVTRSGATVALVIGDVVEDGVHLKLANRVWDELAGLVPFECTSIDADRFDATVKTTRIWGDERKGKATPLDRVLLLERVQRSSRRRGRKSAA